MLDAIVEGFNIAVMFTLAALAGWAVVDDRFKTRIVITAGLSLVCLGALALALWSLGGITLAEVPDVERAIAVLNLGVLVSVAGWLWRVWRAPQHRQRRASDFMTLDEAQHQHVAGGTSGSEGGP